jgi:hypothetical protein
MRFFSGADGTLESYHLPTTGLQPIRSSCQVVISGTPFNLACDSDGLWKAGSAAFPQPLENSPGFPQTHSLDDEYFSLDFL